MDAPTESDIILARFSTYRKDLLDVLSRLTDESLPWAPAPGMRTVAGQLAEIIATEEGLLATLRGEAIEDYDSRYQVLSATPTIAEFRCHLEGVRATTLLYLASLSEADLAELVALPGGSYESLDLPLVPRAEVFRSIVQHEWYHVGQLVSYLWARGDNPYEWPEG